MEDVVADEVPAPVITLTVTNTNQVFISITNGVGSVNYELYRKPALANPSYPWALSVIGTQGQTNFTVNMGLDAAGFFQAAVGSDWDGDGIPNFIDADPSNAGVGALALTIDAPVNGSVIQ